MACEKIVTSKLLEPGSANRRIQHIDNHCGMVSAGWLPDSRVLAGKARTEAANYKDYYDDNIPIRVLNERVSSNVQMHTIYGSIRVFGCAGLIGVCPPLFPF